MPKRRALAWRHLVMVPLAALILVPLYLVIINAFKSNSDILANPFGLPLGRLSFDSLYRVITDPATNVIDAYGFSIAVVALSVVGVVVLGAMVAYVIARSDRASPRLIYAALLGGLLIPGVVILIPAIRILQAVNLMYTMPGLILFNIAFGLPFAVIVYVAFIRSLPRDYEDAARVDGAGELSIFRLVIFPLLKPATATIAIFQALSYWNDFVTPVVLLGPGRGYTITTGMFRAIGQYVTDWSTVFAWLWLTSVPMLILFVVFQRWITAGLTEGALKG